MHRRFILDWRDVSLALLCAGLVLLPVAGTLADPDAQQLVAEPSGGGVKPAEEEENIHRKVTFARANYAWPFARGPYYGDVELKDRRISGVLITPVGSFRLGSAMVLPFPAELTATNRLAAGQAVQYFVVMMDQATLRENEDFLSSVTSAIELGGGAQMGQMPVGAIVARLTTAGYEALSRIPGVTTVMPYHPALKLHPAIGRLPLTDAGAAVSEIYDLDVRVFAGEDAGIVAQQISDLGGTVTGVWPDTVRVKAHRDLLPAVAALEAVQMVFEHYQMYGNAHETSAVMERSRHDPSFGNNVRVDTRSLPYFSRGIDGGRGGARDGSNNCFATGSSTGDCPQVIMVLDSGISVDAGDFSDTYVATGTPGTAHRKVLAYEPTNQFGGQGDGLSCDSPTSGGLSHGNLVAATAAGHATDFDPVYTGGNLANVWVAQDTASPPGEWSLNGVAPKAKVVMYDARVTPAVLPCSATPSIDEGTLYIAPAGGSLGESYVTFGARVVNFSWGAPNNVYNLNPSDIDQFLFDKKDAMVFVSAGNEGQDADEDSHPDLGTLGTPATTKNGLAIGATYNSREEQPPPPSPPLLNQDARTNFTSAGPTPAGRIAPQLMAPGSDLIAGPGLDESYGCSSQSNSNNPANPVECVVYENQNGTSFASPAAAGAALQVRHYFADGFYPDGTDENTGNSADQIATISGALMKAILIASADWVGVGNDLTVEPGTGNPRYLYRFNNEQGYGRIQLNNALPLTGAFATGPSGLIIHDGDVAGNPLDLGGTLSGNIAAGGSEFGTFEIVNAEEEIRVALAWIEGPGDNLVNDLDLEVESPGGKIYYGNYYTDDNNRNGRLDAGEDCPSIDGATGLLDQSPWSLPSCGNSATDTDNPTEAVHLSPDADADGDFSADFNQIETGIWTVRVISRATSGSQTYAIAVSGGVALGSTVRFDRTQYTCNAKPTVTVTETDETNDPAGGLTVAEISLRTTVEVVDPGPDGAIGGGDDTVVDTEGNLTFVRPDPSVLRYTLDSPITLSSATAADPGNGALDVQPGQFVRVLYADEANGLPDDNQLRTSASRVDCDVTLVLGDLVFGLFGLNSPVAIDGGCERNARGKMEFGFPDRYADAGERVGVNFAFQVAEQEDFTDVTATLRCVQTDADSPAACRPGTLGVCDDPNRENNPDCSAFLTVLDSPKPIGDLPNGQNIAANFVVQMAPTIAGEPEVEWLLGISSATDGRTIEGLGAVRQRLDVDEFSLYYSSDFPLGAGTTPGGGAGPITENQDWNNDEVIGGTVCSIAGTPCLQDSDCPTGQTCSVIDPNVPTTNLGCLFFGTESCQQDYRFEQRQWSDMTTCTNQDGTQVTCNDPAATGMPWNFDTLANGANQFLVGRGAVSREVLETVANWGEDLNFNNITGDIPEGNCVLPPPSVGSGALCFSDTDCPSGETCDVVEDRDPINQQIDNNWSTRGGCGWQSRGSNPTTGGVWKTGTISDPDTGVCAPLGGNPGDCQTFETLTGVTGSNTVLELLLTPQFEKVNKVTQGKCSATSTTICQNDADCPGGETCVDQAAVWNVEFEDWSWNANIDLPDTLVRFTWEFDTDTAKAEPVDLTSDTVYLNSMFGEYGAVTGQGNEDLTNGWPVFAPLNASRSATQNGTVGQNRVADLGCFFEGGAVTAQNAAVLGLPTPLDDDCDNERTCVGGPFDGQPCGQNRPIGVTATYGCGDCSFCNVTPIPCDSNTDCPGGESCVTNQASCGTNGDGNIDEFVLEAGPIRNMDMTAFNGPDLRFSTFEDFYGPSGETFQGALGFQIYEGDLTDQPSTGFGVAVDDMVVRWREFKLDPDATDCNDPVNGGQCAVLELGTVNYYKGNSRIDVSMFELSPDPANDCDLDGTPDGTTDCDNDGRRDLVVRVFCDIAPFDEEIVYINEDVSNPGYFVGDFGLSAVYNSPGSLFCSRNGNDFPGVFVEYMDNDDGTGRKCSNDVDPAAEGLIRALTVVEFPVGRLSISGYTVDDDGAADGGVPDGICDRNERCELGITFDNKTGLDLSGVVARLATNDPDVDCIINPIVQVGSIPKGGQSTQTGTFLFRVSDTADRDGGSPPPGLFGDLSATFNVTVASDAFDGLLQRQTLTLDLDLDISSGGGVTQFAEDFEIPLNLGAFTTQSMDLNKSNNALSDGYRCQYQNPDYVNSNSYGYDSCYLGAFGTLNTFDWHQHGPSSGSLAPDGGRGYTGEGSLHYGVHSGAVPDNDTTSLAQLDAVRLNNPINLGYGPVSGPGGGVPELVFKHQISLVDNRSINAADGTSADRGVVQVQLADALGTAQGNWIKLEPYKNVHDAQSTSQYVNCSFDPIDDGNTEDDFFDPDDPLARFGPSSTCFPEFSFVRLGDTDFNNDFNRTATGRASDPPGLQGAFGPGTWVESRFDLARFQGRRIRLRFLATSLEIHPAPTWEAVFAWNPLPFDDGWYIDSVEISPTLTSPATVVVEPTDPGVGNGPCPLTACGSVTPVLDADPPFLDAPGGSIELLADGSFADRCVDGTLQFQFWIDTNGNNLVDGPPSPGDPPVDILLRDWTDSPVITDAPQTSGTVTYMVGVRCSTDTTCGTTPGPPVRPATAVLPVTVGCPSSGNLKTPFNQDVQADTKALFSWTTAEIVDVIRGNLAGAGSGAGANALIGSGSFADTVESCLQDDQNINSFSDGTDPLGTGDGIYYLVRPKGGAKCNQTGSWNSGGPGQVGNRDPDVDASANVCP